MGDAVDNSPVVTFAMKGSHEFQKYAFTIAVTIVVLTVHLLLQKYLWKPLRMRRIMTKQGVAAAPFHIVVGSLPECFAFMSKYSGDLHVDDHYDATPTVSPMNTLYFPKNGIVVSPYSTPANPVYYMSMLFADSYLNPCAFGMPDRKLLSLRVGIGTAAYNPWPRIRKRSSLDEKQWLWKGQAERLHPWTNYWPWIAGHCRRGSSACYPSTHTKPLFFPRSNQGMH